MTLAESKMTKVIEIKCRLKSINTIALWDAIHFIDTCHIGMIDGDSTLTFRGSFDDGYHVISSIIKLVHSEKSRCRMEINCFYE